MPRVFLSHASDDLNLVRPLVRGIERHGLNCWYSDRDLPPGWNWIRAIEVALSTCDCFILLLTPAAARSHFVENEVLTAINTRIPTLIYFVDTLPAPSGLGFLIQNIQARKLPDPAAPETARQVTAAVRALLATHGGADTRTIPSDAAAKADGLWGTPKTPAPPAPLPPPSPALARRHKWALIAGAAVLLLAISPWLWSSAPNSRPNEVAAKTPVILLEDAPRAQAKPPPTATNHLMASPPSESAATAPAEDQSPLPDDTSPQPSVALGPTHAAPLPTFRDLESCTDCQLTGDKRVLLLERDAWTQDFLSPSTQAPQHVLSHLREHLPPDWAGDAGALWESVEPQTGPQFDGAVWTRQWVATATLPLR